MKHLFFVAVATGFFLGASIVIKAQSPLSTRQPLPKVHPAIPLKFIEGIEIVRSAAKNAIFTQDEEMSTSKQSAILLAPVIKATPQNNIERCSTVQFKYAVITDREVESITNLTLYKFIDEWWGIRYQYGGTGRNGIDCSAFTEKLLSVVYGLSVPRTAIDQFNDCEKINTSDLIEGDLVFFNTRGAVSHVGLYLGNNYFVHSSVGDGITISSLTDDYYSRKFISGGRIRVAATPATQPEN